MGNVSKHFYISNVSFAAPEEWDIFIQNWPEELKKEAQGAYDDEDGVIYLRPQHYKSLESTDSVLFNSACSTVLHELLHSCIRRSYETIRTKMYGIIKETEGEWWEGRIHLYFEEALAELWTIYIMMNDRSVDFLEEEYPIYFKPAVYALAGYLSGNIKKAHELFITDNIKTLFLAAKEIEERYGHINIDELFSHREWIQKFCDATFE